eukprot:gb/GECH01007476.1/.p1 GENE.gb/GECH01007476.1/~~gb/GECH01007476.1/.p1  ORF type:complete len:169 (+),score=38.44 gb/GECH01007476.1/:1-507(+)
MVKKRTPRAVDGVPTADELLQDEELMQDLTKCNQFMARLIRCTEAAMSGGEYGADTCEKQHGDMAKCINKRKTFTKRMKEQAKEACGPSLSIYKECVAKVAGLHKKLPRDVYRQRYFEHELEIQRRCGPERSAAHRCWLVAGTDELFHSVMFAYMSYFQQNFNLEDYV